VKRLKPLTPRFTRGKTFGNPPEYEGALYRGDTILARVEALDRGKATLLLWDRDETKSITYNNFKKAEEAAKTLLKRDGGFVAVWKYHRDGNGKEMSRG